MYVCIRIHFLLKKIVLIILVSVFLFNIIGYVGLYELLKYRNVISIEKQINNGIPEKDLVVLVFPLSKFHFERTKMKWTQTCKEFEYNKSRYDIVSQSIKNDSVYFYCIHDTKEEKILYNYSLAVQKNTGSDKNNRKNSQFFHKINIDYYCHSFNNNAFCNYSVPIIYSYFQFYKSYSVELHSPPPKNLV
jgi:hypothetical protein